jgi:ribonuclease P protein component
MKNGRRVRDAYFLVFVIANDSSSARLGLGVSRRVAPRAVDRNRLRRQVRESFRQHQHQFAGRDVVVMAQAAARPAASHELRASLEQHWQQIIARCKPSSCA